MSKIVSRTIDLANLPALSEEAKARLAKLINRPIDYFDIAPLTEEFWKNAVQNPFYEPTKQVATVCIDSDVVMWLKSKARATKPV